MQDTLSSPLFRNSDYSSVQLIQPVVIYTPFSKSVSISEPSEDNNTMEIPKSTVHCKCTKTHCLKLYCDCLKAGQFCTNHCECSECSNRSGCRERTKVLKRLKKMNPQRFKKCAKSKGYERIISCACQKSMCNKKYCSCYQSGKSCSSKCKCVDCNNRSNSVYL